MPGPMAATSDFSRSLVGAEPLDPRVMLNPAQIMRVAALIRTLPEAEPFDFAGDLFPPIGHAATLDFFFAATLQQFGFWEMQERHYHRPMMASLNSRLLKGSDYLWYAYRRQLDRDPAFFSPARQATLARVELDEILQADDGSNPMPAFHLHLQVARAYGQDMLTLRWTPASIVADVNCSSQPRTALLDMLTHVGGYKEDPLRKKAMLLALILEQRPERFLHPAPGEAEPPVIDYHLMRSCLRIGLVEIRDADLRGRVIERRELAAPDEWAIRVAAYQAIQQVQQESGRSMGAVDWFFFSARQRCPEIIEPDCLHCPVDQVCTHRKELFQPVMRTTYY